LKRGRQLALNRTYQGLAILTDLICLAAAFIPATLLRFGRLDAYPLTTYVGTWAFYALWLFMLSIVENLYSFRTSMNRTMYSYRMIRLVLVTTAAYALTVFLLKNTRGIFFDSRIVIVLHMFEWAILGITARMIILPWACGYWYRLFKSCGSCALVVGNPSEADKISALIRKAPVYRQTSSVTTVAGDLPDAPEEIYDLCVKLSREKNCDQVFILFGNHDLNCVAETSILLHDAGIPFVIFSEHILNLGYFDPWLSLEDYGAVSFLKQARTTKNDLAARIMDILIGSVAIMAVSPLLIVVALLIRLSSKGPVFFRQTRVGLGSRHFSFLKFRSMTHDSTGTNSTDHRKYFAEYAMGRSSGEPDRYKLNQKSRITTVGRLIRKTSIDELPQLFNVIRGEMTLVGPRPCIPYELEFYKNWQNRRFTVKPGLTGIWQVYGRSRLPFDHAQFLDFLYTIDMSYSLDFRLVMKTVPVILMGKGGV